MTLKKLPYKSLLFLLTLGASLILGFLSLGGMFSLWPSLSLAIASFVLSVAYEGEIYLQNIKGALSKLFKANYLERQLGNEYLLANFPMEENPPQFFVDYQRQLEIVHAFGEERLTKESAAEKKKAEKELTHMEKLFAKLLFSDKRKSHDDYVNKLLEWMNKHKRTELIEKTQQRRSAFKNAKFFSVLAGFFMGLGTTYLLMEALETIPFFATLSATSIPLLIVPMSIIAGTAYGLLTFNAVTDMISNNTVNKWYQKIKSELAQGITPYRLFLASTALLLTTLAIALTVCTAGTWWTVVKETKPVFTWMSKMPGFIMGVINPIITGLSAVVFNLQNSSESLEIIDDEITKKENLFVRGAKGIRAAYRHLREHENGWQIINPFRIFLKITVMPLRIILFFGHLISIGVTADRVPGISKIVSALLGIISEGFEDLHYFMAHKHHHHHNEDSTTNPHDHHPHHGHDHPHSHTHSTICKTELKEMLMERLAPGHSHNHDVDLPTKLLKFLFTPIYYGAAAWDFLASSKKIEFSEALKRQKGEKEYPVEIPKTLEKPSLTWQKQHLSFLIGRRAEKIEQVYFGREIASEKAECLRTLQHDIRKADKPIERLLKEKESKEVYTKHRFFFSNCETSTSAFIRELKEQFRPG